MSRWIDADALIEELQKWDWQDTYLPIHFKELLVDEAPSIDIVRCKDCKWWIDNLTENDDDEAYDSCRWDWSRKIPTADDFCSYGERRE